MAEATMIRERAHPLAGRGHASGGVSVSPAGEAYRLNLRCSDKDAAAIGKALGIALPKKPKTSASSGSRHALWLGPDEWLVIDDKADPMAELGKVKAAHSAVEVSHRNTAIIVSGTKAADVISHGCPQDLSEEAFQVGACSRTILGKVEIVLLRTKSDEFRVEVWRSFSEYAFDFLTDAAKDPA